MNKALEKIRDEMAEEYCQAIQIKEQWHFLHPETPRDTRLADEMKQFKYGFDAGAKAASEMYEERLKELYNLLGTTYQLAEMGVLLDCNSDHGKDIYEALRDTESFLYPEGQKHED